MRGYTFARLIMVTLLLFSHGSCTDEKEDRAPEITNGYAELEDYVGDPMIAYFYDIYFTIQGGTGEEWHIRVTDDEGEEPYELTPSSGSGNGTFKVDCTYSTWCDNQFTLNATISASGPDGSDTYLFSFAPPWFEQNRRRSGI